MLQKMLGTRDEYIRIIRAELLGPGSEIAAPDDNHELISGSPELRYSMGILFPHDCRMTGDNDEVESVQADTDEPDVENADGDQPLPESDGTASGNESNAGGFASDDDAMDEQVSLATQNMPSSMGLTFLVRGDVGSISCRVSFGTYHSAAMQDCRIKLNVDFPENLRVPDMVKEYAVVDMQAGELRMVKPGLTKQLVKTAASTFVRLEEDECDIIPLLYRLLEQYERGYVREPHEYPVTLNFDGSDYAETPEKSLGGTTAKVSGVRRKFNGDMWSVTLMLVNDSNEKLYGGRRNKKAGDANHPCLFQPCIEVHTADNQFVFCEHGGTVDFSLLSEEEQSLELQYRNKKAWATGLGTAAAWNVDNQGVGMIRTEYFPVKEIPGMDFNPPADAGVIRKAMSMKYLSDLNASTRNEKIEALQTVVAAYQHWIDQKVAEIETLEAKYCSIAQKNMQGCQEACNRMSAGLKTLAADDFAWNAFELANRAMFMQRVHLELQAKTGSVERFPDDEELAGLLEHLDDDGYEVAEDKYFWRLFQIAFLLMSVNAVVDDTSPDRSMVDLIWFPTGGGKTEAYLGLTAMSIFHRRLKYPNACGGTTVMMRYTLRLLTAQQFTRASTLICACEYIRLDAISKRPRYGKYSLGKERITIGLWIGNEHTPGKNKAAKQLVDELVKTRAGELASKKESNCKFQVLKCPWCGTKLVKEVAGGKLKGEWGYRMRNGAHFELFCPNESCFFGNEPSLPIQVVDEELYDNPPSLLFGTVDKFALLPWKPQIGSFFGIGSANRAPELIIQDELHLISGPLGTMVGLYEAAINQLCNEKGGSTRIIASTATIRRAAEQCAALYGRNVAQFPHPGLDAEDSFFSRESCIDHEKGIFGRTYVGLMASGKTKATMQVRTLAALLERMHLMDLDDKVKDSYWTLTVYFNSLKELGKCQSLLGDDVKDSIKRTAVRLGRPQKTRILSTIDELTSRVSTTQLNETLDKLEKLNFSKENEAQHRYASNVVLATNMISVGIDVARLNVMLMAGQPKLTSEYIQASSRVGRRDPGVVFVQYDSFRSRDRSHYEQFQAYHDAYYKYVEPTGLTPFSKPARDRALHAVVIALVRILESELQDDNSASRFNPRQLENRLREIKTAILARNQFVSAHVAPDAEDESAFIAQEIDAILERWSAFSGSGAEEKLFYGERFMVEPPKNGEMRLLKSFNSRSAEGENPYDTMTSMRSVDNSVAGNIRIWEE